MKDPTHKHRSFGDGLEVEVCEFDGSDWPCRTILKWWDSADYKIEQLTEQVKSLRTRVDRHDGQVSSLKENDRRTRLLLTSGILPAFNDLAEGQPVGDIKISLERESRNMDTAEGSFRITVGPEDYSVTYTSPSRTVVNGHVTYTSKTT